MYLELLFEGHILEYSAVSSFLKDFPVERLPLLFGLASDGVGLQLPLLVDYPVARRCLHRPCETALRLQFVRG